MTEKRLLPVSGRQMVKVFGKIGYKVERDLIKDAGLTVEQFNKLLNK